MRPIDWHRVRNRVIVFLFVASFLVASKPRSALAQMNMTGHMMETKDETPPDQLPVPQKLSGIGNVSIKITATPEAQMWFNQGLNLLHDFWEYESARAFEQGVRVDPAVCDVLLGAV